MWIIWEYKYDKKNNEKVQTRWVYGEEYINAF